MMPADSTDAGTTGSGISVVEMARRCAADVGLDLEGIEITDGLARRLLAFSARRAERDDALRDRIIDVAVNVCDAVDLVGADECIEAVRALRSTRFDGDPEQARPEYEARFERAITDLVMRHIDRMNDPCDEDSALRILSSFTTSFSALFEPYLDQKFPGRRQMIESSKTRSDK